MGRDKLLFRKWVGFPKFTSAGLKKINANPYYYTDKSSEKVKNQVPIGSKKLGPPGGKNYGLLNDPC